MCNIAGYIGSRDAAPVLLEMMAKQEGFGGGYYSGLATVHNGVLHHAKVVGNIATLRRETGVERFPGSVGIIHSRPNLGGDREWAHPFVNTAATLALVANGHPGILANPERRRQNLDDLVARGQVFRSAMQDDGGVGKDCPRLADGRVLHSTELTCHHISSLMDACGVSVTAVRQGFMDHAGELVGLVVHTALPDTIVVGRFNQPLMVGFGSGEVFLSTTALAFPERGVNQVTPMPVNCAAAISRTGMQVLPFDPIPGKVADVFPYPEGCEAILRALGAGKGRGLQDLKNATAPLWPKDAAPQKDMMVYEILRALHASGRIRFEDSEVPGRDGTTASRKRACPRN